MRRCTKSRSLSLFLVPSLLALPRSFLKNRDAVFLSGLDLYFSHVMSLHYAAGSGEETVCSCWLFQFRSHPCRQEPRKQTCEFWRRLSLPPSSSDPKVAVILAIGQVFLCSLFRALAPPQGGREGAEAGGGIVLFLCGRLWEGGGGGGGGVRAPPSTTPFFSTLLGDIPPPPLPSPWRR